MKYVKFFITLIIILFCFTLNSELYQSHLQSFSNQYYYIEIENDDRDFTCSLAESTAKKYNQNVFCVERKNIDAFHSEVTVYASPNTEKKVLVDENIVQIIAGSVFSGTTKITIRPFEDVANNSNITRYYFTGSKDSVVSIRQHINENMSTSYVHKENVSIIEPLTYAIWLISYVFLLLLTWMDIQFGKKACFLKVSMGSSIDGILFKNIVIDLVVYSSFFAAVFFGLKNTFFVSYKLKFVCLSFLVFMLLNSVLYFSLKKRNYKEIMYGANISSKLLSNTYIIKALVMVMLIVSLSFNAIMVKKDVEGLLSYKAIENLDGYNTLSVTLKNSQLDNDVDAYEQLEKEVFIEAYIKGKVLLSLPLYRPGEPPVILLNEKATHQVVSNPEIFTQHEEDFVVYVPEDKVSEYTDEDIKTKAESAALSIFGLEKYSYSRITYSHAKVATFDLDESPKFPLGFEVTSDPLIVLCNISPDKVTQLLNENVINPEVYYKDMILQTDDISFLSDEVVSNIKDYHFNGVLEQCNQYKGALSRAAFINSVLSLFLLVLSILLITVIVRMEYMINAKEIALKRIFGYSIIGRNSAVIMLNVFTVLIGFITGVILSRMYSLFSVSTLCYISLAVFILDTVLILINMAVAENKNTAHILKGGSL